MQIALQLTHHSFLSFLPPSRHHFPLILAHTTLSPSPSLALPATQVVVNLYPFRKTVTATPPPSFEVGVENIDIGGPAMIRAAAKNMAHVAVVVDPADYAELLAKMAPGADAGELASFRKKLAWKAIQVWGF